MKPKSRNPKSSKTALNDSEEKKRPGPPKIYEDTISLRLQLKPVDAAWVDERAEALQYPRNKILSNIISAARIKFTNASPSELERFGQFLCKGKSAGLENVGLAIEKFIAQERKQARSDSGVD